MPFVSESVAKSHCYRIYQKMEFRGQQDLLDAIEDKAEAFRKNQWTLMA